MKAPGRTPCTRCPVVLDGVAFLAHLVREHGRRRRNVQRWPKAAHHKAKSGPSKSGSGAEGHRRPQIASLGQQVAARGLN